MRWLISSEDNFTDANLFASSTFPTAMLSVIIFLSTEERLLLETNSVNCSTDDLETDKLKQIIRNKEKNYLRFF